MSWRRTKNKFGAQKTVYRGVTYPSKFEATYAIALDLRLKAKEIASWRRQIPIPLIVHGVLICKYIMDFEVTYSNGQIEYVETKGYETAVWRLKWKLLAAILKTTMPHIQLTLVKNR